jgi:uncharacterized protein (TIGR03083 family)
MSLTPMGPRETAPLFRPLLRELVTLLRSLSSDDWTRPTVAHGWQVRDVAAHLLDGDLRKIAVYRDDHQLPMVSPIRSDGDLAQFINAINASGVEYSRRLSHQLLTDLLEVTGGWVSDVIAALPQHGPARFPVSWAGESVSENWMDIGREYTERWHHQAQIRLAVGASGLLQPTWADPLLDISVRALPRAFAEVTAPDGTAVVLDVFGPTEGLWSVVRQSTGWIVFQGAAASSAARVRLSTDTAWRLFYNALTLNDLGAIEVSGDAALAAPLLRARSVIL